MNAVRIGAADPGTQAWRELRTGRIGGSEIAAVVGLSPWRSRFSLWHEKAGNLTPDHEDTFKTELGKVLEDGVARLYLARNGGHLRRTGMWTNTDRPYQVAAPDRFLVASPHARTPLGILECKTADSGNAHEWGADGGDQDEVPPYYACQVLWYLDTFGLSEATLAVLIGAREYRQYTVHYSPTDAEFLRAQAVAFLDTIRRGEQPSLDGHEATYEAVRDLHPEIEGDRVDIDHDTAQAYIDAIAAFKAAETAKRAATASVADAMGQARTAWCGDIKIASRISKNGGTPFVQAARGLPTHLPTMKEDAA